MNEVSSEERGKEKNRWKNEEVNWIWKEYRSRKGEWRDERNKWMKELYEWTETEENKEQMIIWPIIKFGDFNNGF